MISFRQQAKSVTQKEVVAMNTHACKALIRATVIMGWAVSVWAGDLTPPGPPGPTMRTLAQIEPRTPITSLPYTNSAPGSYYLAANLTGGDDGGILIDADNVTLDLSGFTLSGGAGDGISVASGRRNIVIRNGFVSGWSGSGIGAQYGINCRVTDITAYSNAVDGVSVGEKGLVRDCVAEANQTGIRAAGPAAAVLDNIAAQNLVNGIVADALVTVERCQVYSNGASGVVCGNGCRVTDNRCVANGLNGSGACAGVEVTGGANRIERNELVDGYRGLGVSGMTNVISDNVVMRNGDNYDLPNLTGNDNQVRLLLSEIPETIDCPCYVVLASDLSTDQSANGLTINANEVTVDLNGHRLLGPWTASACAIYQDRSWYDTLSVKNGTIAYWLGSGQFGIQAGHYLTLENVTVKQCASGVEAWHWAQIRDCTFEGVAGVALNVDKNALVERCQFMKNGMGVVTGDRAVIRDCRLQDTGGPAIQADEGALVADCLVDTAVGTGIVVQAYSTVERCSVDWGGSIGIYGYGAGVTVRDNQVRRSEVVGIFVPGKACVLAGNLAIDNNTTGDLVFGFGIRAGANALAFGNAAISNCNINLGFDAGALGIGPMINVHNATSPWANVSDQP